MKNLIEQNGIAIGNNKVRVFVCNHCGALFQSDEYSKEVVEEEGKVTYLEDCVTCEKVCIIDEVLDKDALN